MKLFRRRQKERDFFNQEILPHISHISIGLSEDETFKLYCLFTSLDKDKDGTFSYDEFQKLVGIKHSLIFERFWLYLTNDCAQNDSINFNEFFHFVSRVKGLEVEDFASFTFSIFDVDEKGTLSMYEVDAMLRMISSETEADEKYLDHVRRYCKDDRIALVEFCQAIQSMREIMKPLLSVQEKLNKLYLER